MSTSSIEPIDGTLSGATIPGQSELVSDGNEGVLRILQSSSITDVSPSDCLVSYTGHSLIVCVWRVLHLCREAVGVFYWETQIITPWGFFQKIFGYEILLYDLLFTNPSARAGYDTRSIFKRSLTGLNSEFSFS